MELNSADSGHRTIKMVGNRKYNKLHYDSDRTYHMIIIAGHKRGSTTLLPSWGTAVKGVWVPLVAIFGQVRDKASS